MAISLTEIRSPSYNFIPRWLQLEIKHILAISGFINIISMCSCYLLLLHVCGVHNSKFDINITYSVGVACVSVVAI